MEEGCRLVATDDFYPQENEDLGFIKGEVIEFVALVDENWGQARDGNRKFRFETIVKVDL